MAYFSNGSEGMSFDEECARCRFGEKQCPIAGAQFLFNYDAVNNEVATKILDSLVRDDGTCIMLERFPELLIENDKGDPKSQPETEDSYKLTVTPTMEVSTILHEVTILFNSSLITKAEARKVIAGILKSRVYGPVLESDGGK